MSRDLPRLRERLSFGERGSFTQIGFGGGVGVTASGERTQIVVCFAFVHVEGLRFGIGMIKSLTIRTKATLWLPHSVTYPSTHSHT